MREVRRSALVAQPPHRMFALINDIESYPQFLPWCTDAQVRSRSEREIIASITVRPEVGSNTRAMRIFMPQSS